MTKSIVGLFSLWLCVSSLAWGITATEYKEEGTALFNAGQYPKALVYFNNAVQADPQDWESYEDLGDAYYKLNDVPSALGAYQHSLQLHPDNPTLQTLVDNLQPSGTSDGDSNDTTQDSQVGMATPLPTPTPPVFKDGLASMNHSRYWTRVGFGYDYAGLGDLSDSADTFNNGNFNPGNAIPGSLAYTGSATAGHDNFGVNIEVGLLLNPYMGLAGSFQMIFSTYTANISYDTGDSESLTLNTVLIPFTLDYYLFLPESFGRTFVSIGTGFYFADMGVDQTTTSNNFFGTDNGNMGGGSNEWTGDLIGGGVGFQWGIGQQVQINSFLAVDLFARGYYVKISNFGGPLTDSNGNTQDYGLAASASAPTIVDADLQSNINGSERYATVDFSGFFIGTDIVVFGH
jgi:hypothetical protein